MLLLEIRYDNTVTANDQSTRDILKKGHIGQMEGKEFVVSPEEALYLVDVRNAECARKGKKISLNELADGFDTPKLMARYFTYKDWRERGLVVKGAEFANGDSEVMAKKYPGMQLRLANYKLAGAFFPEDLITTIDDVEKGKRIYDEHWFGQFGMYKLGDRGRLNKLDIYETIFLVQHGALKVNNATKSGIIDVAKRRRPDFEKLYEVYKDWRERGYVVKTGFKFGTHFRIYFPGATPNNDGERVHSKHVVHVFPRDTKLLTSEWARVIRVAHSVRKTFILAIPGKSRAKEVEVDFVLYHRKDGKIEAPPAAPKYAMLSLSEDEYIGGAELSAAIENAKSKKLELVVAIADRETAVTYYKVRRIELPKSDYEYYEIDWMQP